MQKMKLDKIHTGLSSHYNNFAIYFVFNLLVILLINVLIIPPDSHYYVSNINNKIVNQSADIYKLIRSPFYIFFSWAYYSFTCYFIISVFFSSIFSLVLHNLLLLFYNKNSFVIIFVIILSPFIFWVANFGSHIINNSFFTQLFMLIYNSAPLHFGWVTEGFTMRLLSGILMILTIHSLFVKRYKIAGLYSYLSFLAHPNNAISVSTWIVIALFFTLGFSIKSIFKADVKYFFILTLFGLITAIILIMNKFTVNSDYYSKQWYINSYNINASNFSALYYVKYHKYITVARILIAIFFYIISKKNKYNDLISYLIIVPIILFSLSLLIEIGIINNIINFKLVNKIFITSQFGLKILELSFLPIIIVLIRESGKIFKKINFNINKFQVYIISIIFIILIIMNQQKGRFSLYAEAIKNNYNYDLILRRISMESNLNQMIIPLSHSKNDYLDYKMKFNKIDHFYQIKNFIEEKLPVNSLIIVPPYQDKFRDLLPEFEVFYQDVPDASLYLAGGTASKLIEDRFIDLFEKKYTQFNSMMSGKYWSELRYDYLSIDENRLKRIKAKYKNRNLYFLTESGIDLKFNLIASNSAYSFYYIN